ncbi:hypothetical protein Tco_1316848 [Tanacetum coccineum]
MVKREVEIETVGECVDEIDKLAELIGEMQLEQEGTGVRHAQTNSFADPSCCCREECLKTWCLLETAPMASSCTHVLVVVYDVLALAVLIFSQKIFLAHPMLKSQRHRFQSGRPWRICFIALMYAICLNASAGVSSNTFLNPCYSIS